MSKAPVCLVQPVISSQQPPAVAVPSIPQASDLASAISAINAIGAWIRTMTPVIQQLSTQGGISGFHVQKSPTPPQGRWNKVGQTFKTVRVFNPQDKSQFVDVQQIQSVVMRDSQTGEQWIWTR